MFGVKIQKTSDLDDQELTPFIASKRSKFGHGKKKTAIVAAIRMNFWMMTSILFAITTSLLLWIHSRTEVMGSYENGFATDLRPAVTALGLRTIRFTGGLDLDGNARLHRVTTPGEPQYVGSPSDDLDSAWEDLMQASEIILSGEEATDVVRTSATEPDGLSWRLELDVYHSLHCVNELRKALDQDYYFVNGSVPYFYRVHIDHCLDYIRQVIQCHSDMTPLTFNWNEDVHAYLPDFGHSHTCRDFDKVHEWSLQRKALGRQTGHPHPA